MKKKITQSKSELDLQVKSEWPEVGRANETVGAFLESCHLAPDAVAQYTMVVCELVENGIKYGYFASDSAVVRVLVKVARGTVSVQVINPVGESSQAYLAELDRTIQWVRGFQAPFELHCPHEGDLAGAHRHRQERPRARAHHLRGPRRPGFLPGRERHAERLGSIRYRVNEVEDLHGDSTDLHE